mgnify:FL=1
MNNTLSKLKINNEYYTPRWVWDCLKQYIPTNKIIWEAFCCDDPNSKKSAEYLKKIGFDVICNGEDFFDNDYGDIVVSNPPFSKKKEILERLFNMKKPFMLILPNIVLNTLYFIKMAKENDELQIIILPKRVDFIKSDKSKSKATFHTLVICYKINLSDRIIFI